MISICAFRDEAVDDGMKKAKTNDGDARLLLGAASPGSSGNTACLHVPRDTSRLLHAAALAHGTGKQIRRVLCTWSGTVLRCV